MMMISVVSDQVIGDRRMMTMTIHADDSYQKYAYMDP
jgi:hypothetical protein